MLWNAAAVFLTATAVLVGVREGVRVALLHEMDQVLAEDLREIEFSLRDPHFRDDALLRADLDVKAHGHEHHGWFIQFLDAEHRPTWSSAHSPSGEAHLTEIQSGVPASRGPWRVVAADLENSTRLGSTVLVGSSLSSLDDDVTRIDQLVLLIGGGALLAAPLGGYLLARRSTRPFAEMISSARRLRPAHLSERLPRRGTGDELDQLAHSFNALLDRIGEYWRAKQDFLADAAHELRTPLAAIRSSAEVALGHERTPDEYRELLTDVIAETQSLEVLVNQLLLLSAADADRLQVDRRLVPLDELVRRAADMFQGVAESRGIRLEVCAPQGVLVQGNRDHLRQVVNNLIDNALKYTAAKQRSERPSGDEASNGPRIAITLERHDAVRQAVLTVADEGVGIAPDHLPRIFDRFFRADPARMREGASAGTGLGLSICHAVITAHQGQISAQSRLGQGSTFVVTLPLATVAFGDERDGGIL
jgi:heavy metal sensor kinase